MNIKCQILNHIRYVLFLSMLFQVGAIYSVEKETTARKTAPVNDYKSAIKNKQNQIEAAEMKEKSRLLVELAILFLHDQEQEKAFYTYLEAINLVHLQPAVVDLPLSDSLYCDALTIYFDHNGGTSKEKAQKIYNKYFSIVKQKPDSYLLSYVVAMALANLGRYDEFFELFLHSYTYFPEHFLAYKTKAILHIKLYERARTEKLREYEQDLIYKNLELAMEKEPKDDTLYKLMITFSSQKKKPELVRRCLNKILDGNIILPRGDILFFVQEAVDIGEYKQAQSLIEKSRTWYQQSKIINSAQAYLDAHTPK